MGDTSQRKIRVGIYGGSGYGGAELIRILLGHPNAEIAFVTANEQAGKRVADVHRNLADITNLVFEPNPTDAAALDNIDLVFLALPHGQAIHLVPAIPDRVKVIDLSGDFRLSDEAAFSHYYGIDHPGEIQKSFVYGLTETNRDAIRTADRIANPGCFATAAILALAPIVRSGLVTGRIVVDAKTGSSGSGVKAGANTHHPQRMTSFYAYKPFRHQHLPEIREHIQDRSSSDIDIVFMTHSLPVARGIFASCYLETVVNMTNEDLAHLYRDQYKDAPFVRLVKDSPDINWVKTTNFCDIAVHSNGKQIAVLSAIDNLVKGAAGQAVQNMNVMFGLNETAGLWLIGTNP